MKLFAIILLILITIFSISFQLAPDASYYDLYSSRLEGFRTAQTSLIQAILSKGISSANSFQMLREEIEASRVNLKSIDFWIRYFDPEAYRKINGPLPVEWESEVFERYEAPYRREGAGLYLAEQALDKKPIIKDSLVRLLQESLPALAKFETDSIKQLLNNYSSFFLANRLFLLNLSTIYTTGFECPDTARIIRELRSMLHSVEGIYEAFNSSFPETRLTDDYLSLFDRTIQFVNGEPTEFSAFDHFIFIRDYINPLFGINQDLIKKYKVVSINLNDYTLNNSVKSIFDKSLYTVQNTKGIFSLVDDEKTLESIRKIGKLLFYDPILSGNNLRSCSSCHKSSEYFADTSGSTPLEFDGKTHLPRNAPSLINSIYNELLMLDGRQVSLQSQAKDVITSPLEMNSKEKDVIRKVLSCKEYRNTLQMLLKLTPEEKEITLDHIVSAVTYYYGSFSDFSSPFDKAINEQAQVPEEVHRGFNIFMSKGKCATCHFLPIFNGVKPPYLETEFEVLGTPQDSTFVQLSEDVGRYAINKAPEMLHAFRTGTIRNAYYTKPYMHNGVFISLEEVLDFYDVGGGRGKNLKVTNQTLPDDSLKLTPNEKKDILAFIKFLSEEIIFEEPPSELPSSSEKPLNRRKVNGEY